MPISPRRAAKAAAADQQTLNFDFGASKPEELPTEPSKLRYTVSELTAVLKQSFTEHPVLSQSLTIEGELSNVKQSSRGHVYATLKDKGASISAVIWASQAAKLRFDLEEGMAVYATGSLDLYAPNGTYSLVIRKLEPVGIGALQLAFQQLQAELQAEGLFDEERKQPLPTFPARLGIVTSPTGSVLHDMVRVLRQKNRLVDVLVAPAKVQGDGASLSIAEAVEALQNPAYKVDVIIVARGGGSFEDLFCFSEEPAVRAVSTSKIPVISGVGHEPDFSLCDAAADRRASTPTAAAELAVADLEAIRYHLNEQRQQLQERLESQVLLSQQQLEQQADRLRTYARQAVDEASTKLQLSAEHMKERAQLQVTRHEETIAHKAAELDALSPLKVLARGYSAVQLKDSGQPVTKAAGLTVGQVVSLRFEDGQAQATISE